MRGAVLALTAGLMANAIAAVPASFVAPAATLIARAYRMSL